MQVSAFKRNLLRFKQSLYHLSSMNAQNVGCYIECFCLTWLCLFFVSPVGNRFGGYAVGQLITAAVPFWLSSGNKCFCDQREIWVTHIYLPQQHAANITLVPLSLSLSLPDIVWYQRLQYEIFWIDRMLAGPSDTVISWLTEPGVCNQWV